MGDVWWGWCGAHLPRWRPGRHHCGAVHRQATGRARRRWRVRVPVMAAAGADLQGQAVTQSAGRSSTGEGLRLVAAPRWRRSRSCPSSWCVSRWWLTGGPARAGRRSGRDMGSVPRRRVGGPSAGPGPWRRCAARGGERGASGRCAARGERGTSHRALWPSGAGDRRVGGHALRPAAGGTGPSAGGAVRLVPPDCRSLGTGGDGRSNAGGGGRTGTASGVGEQFDRAGPALSPDRARGAVRHPPGSRAPHVGGLRVGRCLPGTAGPASAAAGSR